MCQERNNEYAFVFFCFFSFWPLHWLCFELLPLIMYLYLQTLRKTNIAKKTYKFIINTTFWHATFMYLYQNSWFFASVVNFAYSNHKNTGYIRNNNKFHHCHNLYKLNTLCTAPHKHHLVGSRHWQHAARQTYIMVVLCLSNFPTMGSS